MRIYTIHAIYTIYTIGIYRDIWGYMVIYGDMRMYWVLGYEDILGYIYIKDIISCGLYNDQIWFAEPYMAYMLCCFKFILPK